MIVVGRRGELAVKRTHDGVEADHRLARVRHAKVGPRSVLQVNNATGRGVGVVLHKKVAHDQIVAVLNGATRVHGNAAETSRSAKFGHVI